MIPNLCVCEAKIIITVKNPGVLRYYFLWFSSGPQESLTLGLQSILLIYVLSMEFTDGDTQTWNQV